MKRYIREVNSQVYSSLAMGSAFGSMILLSAMLLYLKGIYASLIAFGIYVLVVSTSYLIGHLIREA
jgi:hypothetical protein